MPTHCVHSNSLPDAPSPPRSDSCLASAALFDSPMGACFSHVSCAETGLTCLPLLGTGQASKLAMEKTALGQAAPSLAVRLRASYKLLYDSVSFSVKWG